MSYGTKVYISNKSICKRIKAFFDEQKLRLIDVTEEEVESFCDFLKSKNVCNKTIKQYANVLRPAFKKAYQDKLIPDNPYDFVSSVKGEKPNYFAYLDLLHKQEKECILE